MNPLPCSCVPIIPHISIPDELKDYFPILTFRNSSVFPIRKDVARYSLQRSASLKSISAPDSNFVITVCPVASNSWWPGRKYFPAIKKLATSQIGRSFQCCFVLDRERLGVLKSHNSGPLDWVLVVGFILGESERKRSESWILNSKDFPIRKERAKSINTKELPE